MQPGRARAPGGRAADRSRSAPGRQPGQQLGGMPVYGGRISVAVDAQGRVLHVTGDEPAPGLALGPEAQLNLEDAARKALSALGGAPDSLASELLANGRTLFRDPASAARYAAVDPVVFPMPTGEGRRAFRVVAHGRTGGREIVLDAVDGRMLTSADLSRDFGSARVFRISPEAPSELVSFQTGCPTACASQMAPTQTRSSTLISTRSPTRSTATVSRAATPRRMLRPVRPSSRHRLRRRPDALARGNRQRLLFRKRRARLLLRTAEAEGALQKNNGARGGVGGDPIQISVLDLDLLSDISILTAPDGLPVNIRCCPPS
ncbi:MAG: hypothetical protein R2748_15230 [Bryobacterales bacterium]